MMLGCPICNATLKMYINTHSKTFFFGEAYKYAYLSTQFHYGYIHTLIMHYSDITMAKGC